MKKNIREWLEAFSSYSRLVFATPYFYLLFCHFCRFILLALRYRVLGKHPCNQIPPLAHLVKKRAKELNLGWSFPSTPIY